MQSPRVATQIVSWQQARLKRTCKIICTIPQGLLCHTQRYHSYFRKAMAADNESRGYTLTIMKVRSMNRSGATISRSRVARRLRRAIRAAPDKRAGYDCTDACNPITHATSLLYQNTGSKCEDLQCAVNNLCNTHVAVVPLFKRHFIPNALLVCFGL